MKARPGIHYVLIEPDQQSMYWVFPEEPVHVFERLRRSWIIVWRARPHVPILEGAPLPSSTRPAEANAKYMSTFFRPWTLLHHCSGRHRSSAGSLPQNGDNSSIPHLSMLGLQHRLAGSTAAAAP